MTDEKKNDSPTNDKTSCCGAGCGCCSGCRCGCRRGRCLLTALLLAAAAFGLFQAGRCSAKHCMAQPPAAVDTTPK